MTVTTSTSLSCVLTEPVFEGLKTIAGSINVAQEGVGGAKGMDDVEVIRIECLFNSL